MNHTDTAQAEDTFWLKARWVSAFTRGSPWTAYEALKGEYQRIRPDASPQEYQTAITRLTRLLGA